MAGRPRSREREQHRHGIRTLGGLVDAHIGGAGRDRRTPDELAAAWDDQDTKVDGRRAPTGLGTIDA
ncbi:MAG: hypothetical protein ACJ714_07950 [Ornithinibacter sp.]